MTDGGTLIMRPSASSRPRFGETQQHYSPSIAPIAIDLEDAFEPARNSDALGHLRQTSQFDYSRSTTNVSFWSGLGAGLATLAVGAAIALIAFTSESTSTYGAALRSPRVLEHLGSSLSVEKVEVAETRFVVAKKKHRARRAVSADDGGSADATASEAAPAPEPSETE